MTNKSNALLGNLGMILGMSWTVADTPGELESLGITGDGAKGFRAMSEGQANTLKMLMSKTLEAAKASKDTDTLEAIIAFSEGVIDGIEKTRANIEAAKSDPFPENPTPKEAESARDAVMAIINKMKGS